MKNILDFCRLLRLDINSSRIENLESKILPKEMHVIISAGNSDKEEESGPINSSSSSGAFSTNA